MQKLLDLIRNNVVARIFVHIFVFNFFCMQCFGMMLVEQRPRHVYREEPRSIYLCNSPDASVDMRFIDDDFALSFEAAGHSQTFSKRDTFFDGSLHHITIGDSVSVSIDAVAHKIFCHRFLWDDSLSFSALGCTLILSELVCKGLVRLAAENIGITGVLSSSTGITVGVSNALENLGVIDAPYVTTYSQTFANVGRVTGKDVTLNTISSASFKKGSSVISTCGLAISSSAVKLDGASLSSKKMNVRADEFSATSASIYATDTFLFNGLFFTLADNSKLSARTSITLNSGKFRNESSKVESDLLQLSLSSSSESFLNLHGEMWAFKDIFIFAKGFVHNIDSKMEAIGKIGIECDFFANAHTSLLEGSEIKIIAANAANHRSIIRSLKGNTVFLLQMNGEEFAQNAHASENARDIHSLAFEDRFKKRRTSDINSRFPRPAPPPSSTSTNSGTSAQPSSAPTQPTPDEDETADDHEAREKERKREIGSFMNFSGEIISAGDLRISGSGALYNVTDSTVKATGNLTLNFLGRILHKYRSKIESDKNIFATTKLGTFFCENSQITSANMKLISQELALDEASHITGTGLLDLRSGVIVNRGLVSYDGSLSVEYGKFDNSGTMRSKGKIQVKPMADFADSRSLTNEHGIIESGGDVSIESPSISVRGKVKAKNFSYRFLNPNATKEYEFPNTLDLSCASATYDFGTGKLVVRSDLEFFSPTRILSACFYNSAVVRAHAPLFIISPDIMNGYEHNLPGGIRGVNAYELNDFDWELVCDKKVPLTYSDLVYIRPEPLACAASIISEDDLYLEASSRLYNSGAIESGKKLTIRGKKAQTGWATWRERTLQLPYVDGVQYRGFKCHDGVFDFPYDFFTPQKSIMRSYGDMEIDCAKFISSFGNVLVGGHLNATVSGLFLNYAGNIRLGQESQIRAREFVNSIGTIATNESGLRYWKIAVASTDPAYLTCNGKLDIIVDSYFKNNASHMHSVGDMFLNGKLAAGVLNGFDPTFVNQSSGTEYCRMYTISGVSVSKTSRHCCGFRTGSSTTTTYWWQDINEIVKDNVIRAAISSAQQMAIDGFNGATNTGVLDAKSIMATNIGEYGFSHGDKSRLQLRSIPEHKRKLAIADRVNSSSLLSDYLFANPITDEVKIPFVIINDGTMDLSKISLAMTIPEYAQAMYQEMERTYSTARLIDMPTFDAGLELALRNSTEGVPVDISSMPNFSAAVSSAIFVKQEHVTSGIYFRPYKYPDTDKYSGKLTLFPELYLSDQSLSSILRDQYGAMHAEDDIGIDTTGRFHANASVASGGHTGIKAKSAVFETQTFDEHTTTQQRFASASGGGLWGSKTSGTKTQWERLITSRSPVFITTGRGLGICLQPGEIADLKGVVAKIGGNLTVQNGNFTLTPLMVSEVSVGENGTYVIPEYFKTILDVDGDAEIDVDLFENTGSEIRVSGKLRIQANQVAQTVLAQEYLTDEIFGTSQSFFSSKARHEKCYAQKIVMPTMSAQDIEMISTGAVSLEGLVTSESDIRIAAGGDVTTASRAFYQSLDYSETVKGPFSHANVRRIFSSPQIAPNIIRANGDFIINTLENYYMDGTQAHIVGNKTVNARNIISRPLKIEQREEIHSDVTSFSVGLPSSVLNAGFSFRFSDAWQQLLMQNPFYRSMHDLFSSRRGAHYASALVQAGLATHDSFRTISEAMTHSNGQFTGDTALELAAKLFDVGTFGISHTSTHQASIQGYGVTSMDYVGGDISYTAMQTASFTGHRASATNITVTAGEKIIVLPDVETAELSMNQQSYSAGFNVITGDMRFGHTGSHGSQFSKIHHPSMFMSLRTNTFQAPKMSFTNPVLKAAHNQLIGDTEFVTLFDISSEHFSSYNFGLSFSSRYGFAPQLSVGGSRGHSYDEFIPESGVSGDIDIVGSLRNDSVPICGSITGNYIYSQRSTIHSSDSFGFGLSGISLSSLDEFGNSMARSILSGLAGYGAGRLLQSVGAGEFWSSLGGSLASMYASDQLAETFGSSSGLSSLGHISESRDGRLLEVELVGFDRQKFNQEIQQIKQTIFETAVADGVSEPEAFERIELIGEYAEEVYSDAIDEGASHEEAITEVKAKSETINKVEKDIHQKVTRETLDQSLGGASSETGKIELSTIIVSRFLGDRPVTKEQMAENDALQFLSLKNMREVSEDPHNESKLRKLRVTLEHYAEKYPMLARGFGLSLEGLEKYGVYTGSVGLTIAALGVGGLTISTAPAWMSATVFAGSAYLVQKSFDVVGESIGSGISYASTKISEWQTDDKHERAELTSDYLLGSMMLLAFGCLCSKGSSFKSSSSSVDSMKSVSQRLSKKLDKLFDKKPDTGNVRVTAPAKLLPESVTVGRKDYRQGFVASLENFQQGTSKLHSGPLVEDLCLVRYYDAGGKINYRWATHVVDGEKISTVADARQHLALLSEWGDRNTVDFIRIPKGTDATFISGRAVWKESEKIIGETVRGGGFQIRFRDFDPSWVVETMTFPKK